MVGSRSLLLILSAIAWVCIARAQHVPKGLILNLDFQNIQEGLIPNKTLYPLYVPLGELGTETLDRRIILTLQKGQGLDIPHSSLLDPDGGEWITSIRIFALTDGLVMSQGNDEKGYAIYIKDGAVHCAIRTNHSTVILTERPENGITDCLKEWVTVEVRIKQETAILSLNRARVAITLLPEPLRGKNYQIRIGEHKELPGPLLHSKTATTTGFTGAIGSLKITRQ